MPPINLQNLTNDQVQAVYDILSKERFSTYMVASGHNIERAMELYVWNGLVGEAFYIPSQAAEVGLRNRINSALIAQYGIEWWNHKKFLNVVDQPRISDLNMVKSRIHSRKLPLVNGQIVAGLSFGFWAGMLQSRYNPNIWSRHLRDSFPHFPVSKGRADLYAEVRNLVELRNRISHHEPLIRRNLMADHSRVMQLLAWLCPTKTEWLRQYCRAPAVIRQKP